MIQSISQSVNMTYDAGFVSQSVYSSTYRAANGTAPAYLSSYFTRVTDVPSQSRLQSSNSYQLIVPSFNLTTVGRRAFTVSVANLWNSLPAHLKLTSASLLTIFRQRLQDRSFSAFLPRLNYLTF